MTKNVLLDILLPLMGRNTNELTYRQQEPETAPEVKAPRANKVWIEKPTNKGVKTSSSSSK